MNHCKGWDGANSAPTAPPHFLKNILDRGIMRSGAHDPDIPVVGQLPCLGRAPPLRFASAAGRMRDGQPFEEDRGCPAAD